MGMRFDEIKNLDEEDILWESDQMVNLKIRVVGKPELAPTGFEGRLQVRFQAEVIESKDARADGELIDYVMTDGLEHYGPNLCWEPEYLNMKTLEPF